MTHRDPYGGKKKNPVSGGVTVQGKINCSGKQLRTEKQFTGIEETPTWKIKKGKEL